MTLKETLYAECFAAHLRTRKRTEDPGYGYTWSGQFTQSDGKFDYHAAGETANLVASYAPEKRST